MPLKKNKQICLLEVILALRPGSAPKCFMKPEARPPASLPVLAQVWRSSLAHEHRYHAPFVDEPGARPR